MEDSSDTGKPYLFIPFRDATTGVETYAAGRYLDLNENTTGFYDLDFNRAYNPYCAYNTGYSCPIPPEENRCSDSGGRKELQRPSSALIPRRSDSADSAPLPSGLFLRRIADRVSGFESGAYIRKAPLKPCASGALPEKKVRGHLLRQLDFVPAKKAGAASRRP